MANVSGSRTELRKALLADAEALVEIDYHQPSNTHIAYCMSIGKNGAKGFGHTPDLAYTHFQANLRHVLQTTSERELQYWRDRCAQALLGKGQKEQLNQLASEVVSGQVGVQMPKGIADWVAQQAEKRGSSRNEVVAEFLSRRLLWLESKVDKEGLESLRFEIKTPVPRGSVEWAQRLQPQLHA